MNFKIREREKAKADEDKYYYNSRLKIHNYYSYEALPY